MHFRILQYSSKATVSGTVFQNLAGNSNFYANFKNFKKCPPKCHFYFRLIFNFGEIRPAVQKLAIPGIICGLKCWLPQLRIPCNGVVYLYPPHGAPLVNICLYLHMVQHQSISPAPILGVSPDSYHQAYSWINTGIYPSVQVNNLFNQAPQLDFLLFRWT